MNTPVVLVVASVHSESAAGGWFVFMFVPITGTTVRMEDVTSGLLKLPQHEKLNIRDWKDVKSRASHRTWCSTEIRRNQDPTHRVIYCTSNAKGN